MADVLAKAQFWQRWADAPMDVRQTLALNRVLDGREGTLNNAKGAALATCSSDTALRDINDLVGKGVLERVEGGGAIPLRPWSFGGWQCDAAAQATAAARLRRACASQRSLKCAVP